MANERQFGDGSSDQQQQQQSGSSQRAPGAAQDTDAQRPDARRNAPRPITDWASI